MMRRNDIQGPLAFEFREGLFLRSSASHKIPECSSAQSQVGTHRAILKIAIGRVKQIELVVLFRFVMHGFSIDHHAQPLFPGRNVERGFKVAQAFSKRVPALAFSDQRQQSQPSEERHFDAIPGFSSLQQLDDLPLKKTPRPYGTPKPEICQASF